MKKLFLTLPLVLLIFYTVQAQDFQDWKNEFNRAESNFISDAAVEAAERANQIAYNLKGEEGLKARTKSTEQLINLYIHKDYPDKIFAVCKNLIQSYREMDRVKTNDFIEIAQNIASLYQAYNRNDEALFLLSEVNDIIDSNVTAGLEGQKVKTSLGGLLIYYGQYERAEMLLNQAMASASRPKKFVNYEGEDLVLLKFFRGLLFAMMKKYEASLLEFKSVEKLVPKRSTDYVKLHNAIGLMQSDLGMHKKAIFSFKRAFLWLLLREMQETDDYALVLTNMGSEYLSMGKYKKADRHLNLGFETYRSVANGKPESLPLYVNQSKISARSMFLQSKYEECWKILDSGIISQLKRYRNEQVVLAESERESVIKNINQSIDWLQTLLLMDSKNTEKARVSFEKQMQLKGEILTKTQEITRKIEQISLSDPKLAQLLNDWKHYRRMLASELQKPKENQEKKLELETKIIDLERRFSSQYQESNIETASEVSFTTVKDKLKDGEAAIEFVHFNVFDKKYDFYRQPGDSTVYAAYVIKKELEAPVFVVLGSQRRLENILVQLDNRIESSYHIDDPATRLLTEFVWSPLSSLLDGVQKLSYSPSGLLHRVSFNAIPIGAARHLVDRFPGGLHRLLSIRELGTDIADVTFKEDKYSAVLIGGVDYLSKPNEGLAGLNMTPPVDFSSNPNDIAICFDSLPHTLVEVNSIASYFPVSEKVRKLTKGDATESAFKNLSGQSPDIIFLGTHGFYLKDRKFAGGSGSLLDIGLPFLSHVTNPLFRSGLLLAGSNAAFCNRNLVTAGDNDDDGILTAYEISELNLTGTQLAILSACETGLGDIKGTEGVYGLQRSLKLAGVRYQIVSLWKVPDGVTAELTTSFFQFWKQGKSLSDAFRAAQLKIRSQKPEAVYWAGFSLIE